MEENEFMDPSFGEIVDLVKQYEEALKTKKNVLLYEENYEIIIQFYQDNHEINKALKVTDTAIEQYPFCAYFYTKKAEIFANQKRFSEALTLLEESEKLDPTDINIFLIRADIKLWQSKHNEALDEVEYALTVASDKRDKCELYLEMADIFEDQEKYTEVVDALKNAILSDTKNEEAFNRFWFCTEITENYTDSIEFLSKLIDQSPYSHFAWFNLGHAYAGLKEYEKSLEAFEYAMAIDENFEPAYVCCGDVLYNLARYSDSVLLYLDAIKLCKPDKELYIKTAECYERLGEYAKSRSYLRKALTVDPYFDEAFYRIGETYRLEEKWRKAIVSFERAVKLSKENLDYLAALADAYLYAGEGEQALEIYERIFQLDPQSKQNWITLASAYFNVENFRKAFQVLNEAELKYENSADIFYIKAVFYLQAGNRHEALLNLERGLLTNFDEHTMIFEMDESLLDDYAVLQVIEQYRN
jgi:tetratricopeptide (TPR) repeat protein